MQNQNTIEKEIKIGEVKSLLENGYKLEVSSPDGWVEISDFVDKGQWDEYTFYCNGKHISCNENHLFQSTIGWISAKEIFSAQEVTSSKFHFLCDTGRYEPGTIIKTGQKVPIVDIQVGHDNHRYYTDGISSHNTNVGKSLVMCHLAAADLLIGRNVLYITLEMAEERIAERIDANLLDIDINELGKLNEERFTSKVNSIRSKTNGKLIIKEYPTASAHVGHFRALLHELKLKRKFIPDVIYIDYLNICTSSRIKGIGGSVNTYVLIKSIAEEIRGLAVEFNLPIWSATQVTRSGMQSSDIDITDTSESFGLPATCDLLLAFISTEELEKANQYLVKQLKNRYSDKANNKRFIVGVDRPKMRLYDVADPTANIINNGSSSAAAPVANTPFSRGGNGAQRGKSFSDFKV